MNSNPSLRAIFSEALDRSDAVERAAYLDEACGADAALRERVEKLLRAHDEAEGFFANPNSGRQPDAGITVLLTDPLPVTEKAGDRIGRYKLLQQIGEGGCGVVYMAEQEEPVRRRVALKVIKLGMDTKQVIARFEAERQALALMDHPNIAKVLDAGATDSGRPYFVMELVRGIKITEYCDQNNLSTEERLKLFTQVCHAIQHAHQKGIIHRDIKPSNILVTISEPGSPGCPKVIDFGIAKATTDQRLTDKTVFTAFEQFIGTPAYMSPEQAMMTSLDIDTRTDIYALGVLLYELLTGQTPFDAKELMAAGLDAMRRIIHEQEPARPSTRLSTMLPADLTTIARHRQAEPSRLSLLLRGDLDWIVMKALEKDRTRRYETANGFAKDIERHLSHEPVAARPPSNLYRFQKLARRNKLAFAAASAVIAALIIGLGVSTWMFIKEKQARQRAVAAEEAESQLRQQAEVSELKARDQAIRNEKLAEERRQGLVRLNTANGVRLMDDGDLYGSLLWFAETMRLEEGNRAREELNRQRCEFVLRQSPKLVRVFFQEGAIEWIAFSKDGRRILTASRNDRTARIWDVNSGQPLSPPLRHEGPIMSAEFSQDGRWVATAGDSTARIWNADDGEPMSAPLRHTSDVSFVAFSPDSRYLATGCFGIGGQIWEVATGHPVGEPLSSWARFVAFSPDGKRIATAGSNSSVWDARTGNLLFSKLPSASRLSFRRSVFNSSGTLLLACTGEYFGTRPGFAHLWDVSSGKEVFSPLQQGGDVMNVEFSPDETRILTASFDGSARVWNAKTGEPITPWIKHKLAVYDAKFSPDGRKFVTVSIDQTARVWDATTGAPLTPPLQHGGRVWRGLFSPDGRYLLTACDDHAARLWDLATDELALAPLQHMTSIFQASYSSDGRRIVTADVHGAAQVWEAATGKPLTPPLQHSKLVRRVTFNSDNTRVVTASEDGTARVWNASTGEAITPPLVHNGFVHFACFSPDGRTIATASEDLTARIWDADTGQPVAPPFTHELPVRSVSFSPDGKRILIATGKFYIQRASARVWEISSGKPLNDEMRHASLITVATYNRDGSKVLTASWDKIAQLWDAASAEKVGPPMKHSGLIYHAAFSPCEQYIVTASSDTTARVWNTGTGEPVTPPLKHDKPVRHASFSPDSRWVVTSSEDQTAGVWDVLTGEAVMPPLRHADSVRWAEFSPDGRTLITASFDKTARIWDISKDAETPGDFFLLAELLAGRQLDSTGGLSPLNPELLEKNWQTFQTDLALDNRKTVSWHEREAALSEISRQWFAAGFHLERLLAANPGDESLRARILQAQGQLKADGNLDLAGSLQKVGRMAEAEAAMREALVIRRNLLGAAHPDVRATDASLVEMLRAQGKLAEAESAMRESISAHKEQLGAAHSAVLLLLQQLIEHLSAQNRWIEADALLNEIVADPDLQPATLRDLSDFLVQIADKLASQGKLAEAEVVWRMEVDVEKKLSGPDHPFVANSLEALFVLLKKQNKFAEAEAVNREALLIHRKGPDLALRRSLDQLVDILVLTKQFAEAEPLARECLVMHEKAHSGHWPIFNAQCILGGILLSQNKYTEAEPLLLSGYEGMKERANMIPVAGKTRPKEALQRLVELYEATDRAAEAAEWKTKLADLDKTTAEKESAAAKP